jgi:hypothetical protein
MRAKEFIFEREFAKRKSATLSTSFEYPSMPSADPYRIYRFSLAMANHEIKEKEGPVSNHAVVVAYTDGDEEIIKAAEKHTGRKGNLAADRGSHEPHSTYTTSPVAAPKRNKYGV